MSRVLVVDDDKEAVQIVTDFLSHEGHTVQTAVDTENALHRLKAWKPHLILLNIQLSHAPGADLISKIRAESSEDYISIILISNNEDMETVTQGLSLGADDYLAKPFKSQELAARTRAMLRFKETQDSLRKALHRIDEISTTDELTGLLNMRALYRRGDDEISRSKRFKKPISALLINIDQFSMINQKHGFAFGSYVLQEVAKKIKTCLRSIDLAGRIGADEFLVILVESDLATAEFMAERVRDSITAQPYIKDKSSVQLQVCVGVAGLGPQQAGEEGMGGVYHSVSEALRSAKANGANRIEIYSFA